MRHDRALLGVWLCPHEPYDPIHSLSFLPDLSSLRYNLLSRYATAADPASRTPTKHSAGLRSAHHAQRT